MKKPLLLSLLLLLALLFSACSNLNDVKGTSIFEEEIAVLLECQDMQDYYTYKNVVATQKNVVKYSTSKINTTPQSLIAYGDIVFYTAIEYTGAQGFVDSTSKKAQQNVYMFNAMTGQTALLFDWRDVGNSGLPIDFIGHKDYIYHSVPQLVDGDTLYFTLYCMYTKMSSDTLTFRFLCSYDMQSRQFALVYDFAEENQAGINRSILESGYFLQDGKLYFPEYPPHPELGWKARLVSVDIATKQVQYLADDQCPIYLPFFVNDELGYVYDSRDAEDEQPIKTALGDSIIFEADSSPNDIASHNDKMVFNYLPFLTSFAEQGISEKNFALDITSILALYQHGKYYPIVASRYNELYELDMDDNYVVWSGKKLENTTFPLYCYDIKNDIIMQVAVLYNDAVDQQVIITENYIVYVINATDFNDTNGDILENETYYLVVEK